MRRKLALVVKENGFIPVPRISAQRMVSQVDLGQTMDVLHADATGEHVFDIAGDPVKPEGLYEDALDLISAARAESFVVQIISNSGYPEGHPEIMDNKPWAALEEKVRR